MVTDSASDASADLVTDREAERAREFAPPSAGVSPYAQLLAEQLVEERARKQSLEQRGLAVLSTSGFFITVLFGAVGWGNSSTGALDLSLPSKIALGIAIASLLSAGICGLVSNFVKGYQELSLDALPDLYERLNDPLEHAERRAFRFRSNILDDSRRRNESKARNVKVALSLQVIAAFAIGYVVLDIAYSS